MQQQSLPPSEPPVRYFVEEKLVFAIESARPWNLEPEGRRRYLREILPGFFRTRLGLDNVTIGQITIFDRQTVLADEPSSVDELAPISAVTALVFATVDGLDDEMLIRKVEEVQAALRESQGIALAQDPPLIVTAISPDWLATTAAEQRGTGGPGGRPVAWLESDGFPHYELVADETFTGCSRALHELFEGACQREIDVAILDTAPSQCVLQDAYRFWGPGSGVQQHPLVEALLDPNTLTFDAAQINQNTRLWICYADSANYPTNPEMARLNSPLGYGRIIEQSYRMPDHGLFVAGIIHSLVPQARLHLIQVINDWGICSISSIVAGLEKLVEVRARLGRRVPLVINLSLVLSLPREKVHEAASAGRGPDWLAARRETAMDVDMGLLFQKIATLLSGTPNSIIVAAAGNDGIKRTQGGSAGLPKTRYPAAFTPVTGVGALEQITRAPGQTRVKADYTPYSNAADDPEKRGFITFGGRIAPGNTPDQATADKTGGILGIYTGDFPDGTFNTTGWARWAGTSFATPVIAGLIAKMLCMDATLLPADAETSLRDLVAEASTTDAEIVPVHQPL